jgi:hypothetical protein
MIIECDVAVDAESMWTSRIAFVSVVGFTWDHPQLHPRVSPAKRMST